MSERRACRVVCVDRSSVRYQRRRRDDDRLRDRLKALAEVRRRFGYRRLWVLLRREGHIVNRKRVYRLYKEERLMVRRRGGRKRAIGVRSPMPLPGAPNQRWSLDFVHDQMTDRRRLRILAVVDDYTRECLALVADTSISGIRVARELDKIVALRGRPGGIVSDNGTELTSTAILAWSDRQRVAWHYIAPGKAGPERLHREFQWSAARRVAERNLVPFTAACPRGARYLALGLQYQASAFEPRLADTDGFRGSLAASVRATGQGALAI